MNFMRLNIRSYNQGYIRKYDVHGSLLHQVGIIIVFLKLFTVHHHPWWWHQVGAQSKVWWSDASDSPRVYWRWDENDFGRTRWRRVHPCLQEGKVQEVFGVYFKIWTRKCYHAILSKSCFLHSVISSLLGALIEWSSSKFSSLRWPLITSLPRLLRRYYQLSRYISLPK